MVDGDGALSQIQVLTMTNLTGCSKAPECSSSFEQQSHLKQHSTEKFRTEGCYDIGTNVNINTFHVKGRTETRTDGRCAV